ncbi:ATP-binding protein [Ekhidna sp.]|uniref:ATP-binding protein n=1 Tax=Ekhidna sp. TaxID=2608089 RepID=UPI003B59F964
MRLFTSFACLLLLTVSYSQFEPLYKDFIHYDTDDGIPQSFITGIVQDQQGFIWISTRDGIARFDGKNFRRYAPDEKDLDRQLSTNAINDLYLDDKNNLWIYNFNNQVDRIDLNTGMLQKDVPPVLSISKEQFRLRLDPERVPEWFFKDEQGLWFAGGEGEYRLFDASNNRLKKLFEDQVSDSIFVAGFTTDERNGLWMFIGAHDLIECDSSWSAVSRQVVGAVPENRFRSRTRVPYRMRYLKGDRLFLQIPEKGSFSITIVIYDIKSKKFRRIDLPYETRFTKYIENFTYANNGDLIFEYHGKVLRLSEDEQITLLWEYPYEPALEISSLHMDRSNNLWIGTNTGGLFSIDTNQPAFQAYEYERNFLYDLLKYHSEDSLQFHQNWDRKRWAYGFRYVYDEEKNLYMTNEFQYSHFRKVFKNGKLLENMNPSYPSMFFGIDVSGNYLWTVTNTGELIQYSKSGNVISEVVFMNSTTDYNQPVDLVVDERSQWVITTSNELFEIADGKVKNVHNPVSDESGFVFLKKDIQNDSIFWIGTLGAGLLQWNKYTRETARAFTERDGLPNTNMAGMVQDSLGNLWVSTFNGVAKIEDDSWQITTFNQRDGLHGSEFNRHHVFEFPDGRIAFGGPTGYTIFNPYDLGEANYSPEVRISSLYINNVMVDEYLPTMNYLELSYDQNSIVVDMAAMQYNDPSSNKFRYRLDGFNKEWINNEENERVRFDNLGPGNYTLNLEASNTNGLWSGKVRKLAILINPPIWQTWWAYTAYALFIGILVIIYWRSYRKRVYREQEMAFNKREAERLQEMDNIKSRFFSNITHEFRTPLTLILAPLEKKLREKEYPDDIRNLLESNHRHGNHLLKLVNQLLDISKLESGNIQSLKSVGEIAPFVGAFVDQFREYANDKNLTINYVSKEIGGQYLFDKEHWEKVIMNLISNAIKFTPEGGRIDIALSLEKIDHQEAVGISVKDTGIGIPAEKIDRLFDRFYQIDDSDARQQEGTGIGLSLVKELTELMDGTIAVASEVGVGTTFKLTLPVEALDSKKRENQSSKEPNRNREDESTILIVEDNPELRSFISESLSSKYSVLSASNGREALEMVKEHLPDIIISDVMMPGMSGYELCQKIKEDIRTNHIRFIMLTAKTAQSSKEKGLETGADDYLTKPFHTYELELRISNVLTSQANLREKLKRELLPENPSVKPVKVEDPFLQTLYTFLEGSYTNSKLDVSEIADAMSMSKSTLNRKLKSMLNTSAISLLKQYRLQKAVVLLEKGESIANTAYATGFESPSYFTQSFKEVFQSTPSEYKKVS